MRRTFRKLALTTLVIAALLHEPTLRACINLLVTLHIVLRIGFDILRNNIATWFPTFAAWVVVAFHQIQDFVYEQLGRAMLALSPLIERIAIAGLSASTVWLRESPRYLCEVNEWLMTMGEAMASKLANEGLDNVLEQLLLSGEQVVRLCAFVRA